MPREQLVLIPTALEQLIPSDHPVRLVDEIFNRLDWMPWEAKYHGSHGQPPIHPSILAFGHQGFAGVTVQLISEQELRATQGPPARLAHEIVLAHAR